LLYYRFFFQHHVKNIREFKITPLKTIEEHYNISGK